MASGKEAEILAGIAARCAGLRPARLRVQLALIVFRLAGFVERSLESRHIRSYCRAILSVDVRGVSVTELVVEADAYDATLEIRCRGCRGYGCEELTKYVGAREGR